MPSNRTLFDLYSQNWQLVKSKYSFTTQIPDFVDAVICPLCMHILKREALDKIDHPKQLTGEHLPPEALGGNKAILLCRECNTKTGAEVDINLLEFHKAKPFLQGEIGASIDVQGELSNSEGKVFHSTLKFQLEGGRKFFLQFNINDQYRRDRLSEMGSDYKLRISGKSPSKKSVQIALLKIAYLKAFERFGHSFILSGAYNNIRQQILNPTHNILPCFGVMDTSDIPISVGQYFVRQPVDLRGFLIVFEVEHGGKIDKNAVLLPPSHVDDILYYYEVMKYRRREIKLLDFRKFSDSNFLTNPELTFVSVLESTKEYTIDIKQIGFYR